jgi:cardiolipin synthase
MRANFRSLLSKGVKIYRTSPPFDNSKIMIVDGSWLLVGSANWDVRSFKLNFECNMECIDVPLARKVEEIIKQKKDIAKQETLENTPFFQTLLDKAFKLLTPYY